VPQLYRIAGAGPKLWGDMRGGGLLRNGREAAICAALRKVDIIFASRVSFLLNRFSKAPVSILKRNNVKVCGRGPIPMLFAHGYGCDQKMWRLVTPAFENDYRVVLFDHVGAGGSDLAAFSPAKYANLKGYAQDVLEICRELDLQNVEFVGHSVSSMIGLLAAVEEPSRFADLIMIGPSPCYIDDPGYKGGFSRADIEGLLDFLDSNYLGWSTTMAPVIMGNPERPELSEELTNSFCRTDPEIAKQFARVTFLSDNREDLPRLTVPSLILQCDVDAIAPLPVGTYLHSRLPESSLRFLKATGHCPQLSAPEETIREMKNYLAMKN
jgi:sigma-B regulation protein RsbQ